MLPLQFQRKVGLYNVKINNVPVKATVLEHEYLVDDLIHELRSRLGSLPVVGIDLKTKSVSPSSSLGLSIVTKHEVLILFAKDSCLIIQMERLNRFPQSLLSFLSDETICFVGVGMNEKRSLLQQRFEVLTGGENGKGESILRTGVEIGYFAARVRRNRALKSCDLEQLTDLLGLRFKEDAEQSQHERRPDYIDLCLSDDDVKFAIRKAFMSYSLGIYLSNML